jgi:hypothetical protein
LPDIIVLLQFVNGRENILHSHERSAGGPGVKTGDQVTRFVDDRSLGAG